MQFLSTRFFVNKETGRWESERFIIRNWLTWLWRLISPKIHSWEGSWEGDFPGSAVAKTPCSKCRDPGSITGQGPRSPMLFPNFGFQMFNYDVSCTVPVWVQAWRQGKIDVSAWTLSGKEKTNSPYSVSVLFKTSVLWMRPTRFRGGQSALLILGKQMLISSGISTHPHRHT